MHSSSFFHHKFKFTFLRTIVFFGSSFCDWRLWLWSYSSLFLFLLIELKRAGFFFGNILHFGQCVSKLHLCHEIKWINFSNFLFLFFNYFFRLLFLCLDNIINTCSLRFFLLLLFIWFQNVWFSGSWFCWFRLSSIFFFWLLFFLFLNFGCFFIDSYFLFLIFIFIIIFRFLILYFWFFLNWFCFLFHWSNNLCNLRFLLFNIYLFIIFIIFRTILLIILFTTLSLQVLLSFWIVILLIW